jgi:TonB family protein
MKQKIKSILIFSSIFAFAFASFAQENISDEDVVFAVAEKMPEFPSGQVEMYKFISENAEYPAEAMENGEEGRVILQFVVEPTGKISDIKVIRGISPSLDKEAIRVVELMPDFIPGEQRGNKVRVMFTLPVTFKLPEIEEDYDFILFEGENLPDEMPEFPGGMDALHNFLANNIRYPVRAQENREQGWVVVQFIVSETGEVVGIEIVHNATPLLDLEVIRVISLIPNWTPGIHNGKKVNTNFILPVKFCSGRVRNPAPVVSTPLTLNPLEIIGVAGPITRRRL